MRHVHFAVSPTGPRSSRAFGTRGGPVVVLRWIQFLSLFKMVVVLCRCFQIVDYLCSGSRWESSVGWPRLRGSGGVPVRARGHSVGAIRGRQSPELIIGSLRAFELPGRLCRLFPPARRCRLGAPGSAPASPRAQACPPPAQPPQGLRKGPSPGAKKRPIARASPPNPAERRKPVWGGTQKSVRWPLDRVST